MMTSDILRINVCQGILIIIILTVMYVISGEILFYSSVDHRIIRYFYYHLTSFNPAQTYLHEHIPVLCH